MDPFPPPLPTPTPARRRWLRFAIKVPLGCLAFLIGATAVAVLGMPWALGTAFATECEAEFGEFFEGHLHIGEAWLPSLYGDQWLDGVRLEDPEGELVLEGGLRTPNLLALLLAPAMSDPEHWEPIEVTIDRLHLRMLETGESNLTRALTPRVEIAEIDSHVRFDPPSEPIRIPVSLSLRHGTWSNPTLRRAGLLLAVDDLALGGELMADAEQVRFTLAGRGVTAASAGSRGAPGSVGVDFQFGGPHRGGRQLDLTWFCRVEGRDAAARELLEFIDVRGDSATAFGERLDEWAFDLEGDDDGRLRLTKLVLRGEGARLALVEGEVVTKGLTATGTALLEDFARDGGDAAGLQQALSALALRPTTR